MGVKLIDAEKRKFRVAFWYQKKHYARIVTGTKKLAQEVESKMRLELAEGRYFPERSRPNLGLGEAAGRFLDEYARHKPSYKHYLYNTISAKEFFGSKSVNDITPDDVRRYRVALKESGLHPVTVNHRQKNLRRIFGWLKELGLFSGDNPASGSKVALENERPYWRREFLSAEQFEKLVGIADPRIRPMVVCAAFTGMRLGEIKALRRKDVDLNRRLIYIRTSKNGEPGTVPITDTLFAVLEPIIKMRLSDDSQVFDFSNFERLWKKARRLAGIPKFHFHDLRHTFASHVAMGAKDSYAVQQLLRLKTPGLVQRYAHLLQGHLRKAVLALDKQLPLGRRMMNAGVVEVGVGGLSE